MQNSYKKRKSAIYGNEIYAHSNRTDGRRTTLKEIEQKRSCLMFFLPRHITIADSFIHPLTRAHID
jgi:hypothetical protein